VTAAGAPASEDPRGRSDAVGRRARIGVVGVSIDDPCGVRDHAERLAVGLAGDGLQCSMHWLSRAVGALLAERDEVGVWSDSLAAELAGARADAVLLHYSVFAYSHRGVPIFVRPVLAALRRSRLPLVVFMHEFAYPWHLGGARGKVWAASHRLVLRGLVARSDRLVVSAEGRAAWLRSRTWLKARPTYVAPVFSNLPSAGSVALGGATTIGLFGYGHEGVEMAIVLDALRDVRARGGDVRLTLLGAPGAPSDAAGRWQREAAARGLAGAIDFSGRLPAQRLAEALARCDVLLFAERGGPTSRKTTLAASLASGRPVVALDGPSTWPELAQARGAVIVAPRPRALADALVALLGDRGARETQGRTGREFGQRSMSIENSVEVIAEALRASLRGTQG
jgi:glycosyltransferase involved in cell wall biosynthesis